LVVGGKQGVEQATFEHQAVGQAALKSADARPAEPQQPPRLASAGAAVQCPADGFQVMA
jgi:hypothetical protein